MKEMSFKSGVKGGGRDTYCVLFQDSANRVSAKRVSERLALEGQQEFNT